MQLVLLADVKVLGGVVGGEDLGGVCDGDRTVVRCVHAHVGPWCECW